MSQKELQETIEKFKELKNKTAVAKALGITRRTVINRLKKAEKLDLITESDDTSSKNEESFEKEVSKDSIVIRSKSSIIRTLEDALEEAKVDLDIWEVDRYIVNKWDMGSKTKDKNIQVTELWQIKVWLKRKVFKPIEVAIKEMLSKLDNWSPTIIVNHPDLTKERHLLEVALFDNHFGKLCWGVETGTDYDIKIAERLYYEAVEDLLDRISGYNIEQILLPIGNDFFHINNWQNTTEHGTQQDVDSRMAKIFEIGCNAVIRGVEKCLEIAPVNILWIPGNHDRETSWYMVKYLQAWYRTIDEVRVNVDPQSRKYVGYGINLIGFTHGDEEPHQTLPTLMATEVPELWAKSSVRVWHLGHLHKKKETSYNVGDTYNGVRVQIIPSLTATDAWHYKKGYVKSNRVAETWLWSYTDGYVGHFSVNMRA